MGQMSVSGWAASRVLQERSKDAPQSVLRMLVQEGGRPGKTEQANRCPHPACMPSDMGQYDHLIWACI